MKRIAFVCVGNAGRSQLATALAERERDQRDLAIEIVTGGTEPADHVHEEVVTALREIGIDAQVREPRRITPDDVADASHVVTMGCGIEEFAPPGWDGRSEVWELEHPGGSLDLVRAQRDEIAARVKQFFDQLEFDEA